MGRRSRIDSAAALACCGPSSLQQVQAAPQACVQRLKLASRVLEDTVFSSFGSHGTGERHGMALKQVEAMAVKMEALTAELKCTF